jgi:1,4-alpha-glucan branching enzyme
MIYKRASPDARKVVVTFEIPSTIWAERINLVGDFNDWDQESLPFRQAYQENWQVEVELDAGREYRFRYLFDGEHWRYDWHADKSLPNPHGAYDSVVMAALPLANC